MSTIEVRDLSKRFGDLTAVDSVDMRVEAGEVLCLLGPSGCGKTTTLRMIAGLEVATEGEVLIGGTRVNDLTPAQRDIAMVFQFYALYPSLTVAENLAFPLHAEKISKAEINARVHEIAGKLDLLDLLDRIPGRLGEGEKQRVAVARAIVRDPTCFLFDEPLSRLDIELRQVMRGQIKEVLSELSKATVIVTHDQLEALTMADRIAVMRDGLIEQIDTPHGIFAEPRNTFVAGFIGTPGMNLLEATLIERSGDTARFRVIDQEVTLTLSPETIAALPAIQDGGSVTIGIRPRAYQLASGEGPDTFSAVIDIVEPMGAEVLVHMQESGLDVRVVVPRGTPLELGERIHMRCKPGQAHVFNADGELMRS
jgi:ABC-type sugar transport system ATPase subunit